MKEDLYSDVVKEWKGSYKTITYKGRDLDIVAIPHPKPKYLRVFYIGSYYLKDYLGKWHDSTIESIHYDKVVSRFQRFVDEYCTDWQARVSYLYKGYDVRINQERDKEFYIGYVHFHKNSIYKYIADTREEVEINCKNRIDKVVKEKEKVQRKMLTPKQEKIQELEQLQARISAQLEELKKESFTLTHKGVTLDCEQGKDDTWIFVGKIRNAPENIDVRAICGDTIEEIQRDFEEYVDWLEKQVYLYSQITGKELCTISK